VAVGEHAKPSTSDGLPTYTTEASTRRNKHPNHITNPTHSITSTSLCIIDLHYQNRTTAHHG